MTNDINFDKTRYIELLKKQEILRNEETSLFYENREENLELLSYSVILQNQIFYNGKVEYISLVEEYLRENAGEDGARLFVWEFFSLFKEDIETSKIFKQEILEQGIKRLATFCTDPKSKEFSVLLHDIVSSCEFFTFSPEDIQKMTLDEFRNSIEIIFFEMQKYLDE